MTWWQRRLRWQYKLINKSKVVESAGCSVDDGDHGDDDNGITNLFISPKWLSQLSFEWQLESKVVESDLLGVAATGSGISAETPLLSSSGPCQQIWGSRDAHLHPVFHRARWYCSPVFTHQAGAIRPELPPVTTPEHSIPEAKSSGGRCFQMSTKWCWLSHGSTHHLPPP